MDPTLCILRLETSPVAKGLLHVGDRSPPPPWGWRPTCSSLGPEHLQPQLGRAAELPSAELGSGKEGFPPQAQAREHHHLGKRVLSSTAPRPRHPAPTGSEGKERPDGAPHCD